jgi:hypothetical protein
MKELVQISQMPTFQPTDLDLRGGGQVHGTLIYTFYHASVFIPDAAGYLSWCL